MEKRFGNWKNSFLLLKKISYIIIRKMIQKFKKQFSISLKKLSSRIH